MSLGSTTATQCFIEGRCEQSNYIHASIVNNPLDCLHNCQANPECKWFTIDESDGFCMEFTECVELSTEFCHTCTSGESTCSDPLQCSVPGECHGTYISADDNVKSEDECLRICKAQNEPNCQWYTYLAEFQYCLTYTDCSYLDESELNALSGQKNCSLTTGNMILEKNLKYSYEFLSSFV